MSKSSLIIITTLLITAGCTDATKTDRPLPPRTVLVAPVQVADASDGIAIGTVRSSRLSIVASEQGGRVVALLADVGSRVAAGQPLARLDATPARLRADHAVAELQRAAAAAEDRERNLARVRTLHADKAASDADLETARTEAATAKAALDAAASTVALARRDVQLTVLRAPTSGVIASRPALLSSVLAPGAPAFEIEGDGERQILALIPADKAERLGADDLVTFRYQGGIGEARLLGISARDNGTGAREATLAVVSGAPAPGATVEVLLTPKTAVARATVPLAAVIKGRSGNQSVQLVGPNNKLREIPVTLLAIRGASAQVAGPLAAGQLVVAAGSEFLQAGMTVQPHLAQR